MKQHREDTERRQYERAPVQDIILGILNSGELETIGSISDISLGGAKYTYNGLRIATDANPIHSIDLIADNHFLFDIPCECAWNVRVHKKAHSKGKNLRKCGIQFGDLSPKQIFLLQSFLNRCAPLGDKDVTTNAPISCRK